MWPLLALLAAALSAGTADGASTRAGVATPGRCTATTAPGRGLQRFVDRLRPGSIGCLAPGDYDMKKLVLHNQGTGRNRITLTSADPKHRATLHGLFWVAAAASYWTISDLNLDGRNARNLPSPLVDGDDTVWLRDDVTNNHAGDGTTSGGICFLLGDQSGQWGVAADTVIAQSRIHDCGISDNSNHGIYISATEGRTLIANNWIYRNGDRGIQLFPAAANVTISHNVIDGNGSGVIFSGSGDRAARDDIVVGNIISNSRHRWNVESWFPDGTAAAVGNLVTANCFWADSGSKFYDERGGVGPSDGFAVAGNNVVQRPRFLGPGDMRLARGSGCVGYGPKAGKAPAWR